MHARIRTHTHTHPRTCARVHRRVHVHKHTCTWRCTHACAKCRLYQPILPPFIGGDLNPHHALRHRANASYPVSVPSTQRVSREITMGFREQIDAHRLCLRRTVTARLQIMLLSQCTQDYLLEFHHLFILFFSCTFLRAIFWIPKSFFFLSSISSLPTPRKYFTHANQFLTF